MNLQADGRALVEVARLDKPIGIWLLLWPTLTALWLAGAGAWPSWRLVLVFSFGSLLVRSAGCVINDIADRDLDPLVARTQHRPLAEKRLSVRVALAWCALLFTLAFGLVYLGTNTATVWLSVGGLAIACAYPFVKRVSHYPQFVLGVAFSWGIPMAYTATTGATPPATAWLLFAANVLWTIAYDTQYAMVDRPFDVRAQIKSTAIVFGEADIKIIRILHLLVLALLITLGTQTAQSTPYFLGLIVIAALFLHQWRLIKDRNPQQCFIAFRHNHWVGLTLFAGVCVDSL